MDTLTHVLAGTAISDGWFRKRLGPVATPFALAMSVLPDIDSVTYLISVQSAWANHRGYTHSIFVMLAAAPVLGTIGYLLSKRSGEWRLWTLLTFLCLICHTFFDVITSWGTMPFLPLSTARVSLDIAPIIDVFMFSLLAASFVINRLLRWERTETFLNPLAYPVVHRHPKRRQVADWTAKVVIVLVMLYLVIGWRQNSQTVRLARSALVEQGITPVEVRALPIMFTYIAWELVARDADGTIYNGVHSSYAPKPMMFIRFPTLPRDKIVPVLATSEGAMFTWYSQGMVVADEGENGEIRLSDRRFWNLGKPYTSRFSMTFSPNAEARWAAGSAAHTPLTKNMIHDEFQRLWRLTWDGEWETGPVDRNGTLPDKGESGKS